MYLPHLSVYFEFIACLTLCTCLVEYWCVCSVVVSVISCATLTRYITNIGDHHTSTVIIHSRSLSFIPKC